ncbi:hypothetical protein ACFQO1_00295 [Jejudonia soesokkakensis]|uniref:Beta-lactamase-inhibitor-like PepSY-like domain-containing protein n=1 Tax=Jejudonia soesokkakensis TaxID=1323432 RepID=A0ABW2MQI7_9FLAO
MNSLKQTILVAILSCLFFSFSNCGGAQEVSGLPLEENPPFTIAEAAFQKWVAGTREGGSGIELYINISNVSEGVVFNDIYFRNKKTTLFTSPTIRSQYRASFTSAPSDRVMDLNPEKEAKNTPPVKFPFQLKDTEAVVSYTYKGNSEYFKITQLDEKEMIAYPGGNPNDEN